MEQGEQILQFNLSSDQWVYSRDSGIRILANELSEICTPRILLFRLEFQCTDTQIKYKLPIVTTRLNHLSYLLFTFFNLCLLFPIFVHKFLLFWSHRKSCRDSISSAYSCFIPKSLLYCHCKWKHLKHILTCKNEVLQSFPSRDRSPALKCVEKEIWTKVIKAKSKLFVLILRPIQPK